LDLRSAPDDIFGPWALERSRLDGVLSVLQRSDLAALAKLTAEDRSELERLLRAAAASSPVQKPIGSTRARGAGRESCR
jgi:hypothetical protein